MYQLYQQTIFSWELNVLCRDIDFDFLKIVRIGKIFVDMMFSSSVEQHTTSSTRIFGNGVNFIVRIWSNNSLTVQSGVFDTRISDCNITFALPENSRNISHKQSYYIWNLQCVLCWLLRIPWKFLAFQYRVLQSLHNITLYIDINPSTDHTTLISSELAQVQTWINATKLHLSVEKLTIWRYQNETKLKT